MLADICVENCGHLAVKQEITTKMPHCGNCFNQIVDFTIISKETLKKRTFKATLVTILHYVWL